MPIYHGTTDPQMGRSMLDLWLWGRWLGCFGFKVIPRTNYPSVKVYKKRIGAIYLITLGGDTVKGGRRGSLMGRVWVKGPGCVGESSRGGRGGGGGGGVGALTV